MIGDHIWEHSAGSASVESAGRAIPRWGLAVSRSFGDLLLKEPQKYGCSQVGISWAGLSRISDDFKLRAGIRVWPPPPHSVARQPGANTHSTSGSRWLGDRRAGGAHGGAGPRSFGLRLPCARVLPESGLRQASSIQVYTSVYKCIQIYTTVYICIHLYTMYKNRCFEANDRESIVKLGRQ